MQLSAQCPFCDEPLVSDVSSNTQKISCNHCGKELGLAVDAWRGDRLAKCLVCPCDDLFTRKDFPQGIGLTIIVCGFALSYIAWIYYYITWAWGILFATAAIDVALYLLMPEVVVCYRCQAHYRSPQQRKKDYAGFDLSIHERYRQESARLAEHSQGERAV